MLIRDSSAFECLYIYKVQSKQLHRFLAWSTFSFAPLHVTSFISFWTNQSSLSNKLWRNTSFLALVKFLFFLWVLYYSPTPTKTVILLVLILAFLSLYRFVPESSLANGHFQENHSVYLFVKFGNMFEIQSAGYL